MRLKESLKSSFLAGVVLVAPLVATLVILRFVTNLLAGQMQPIVEGTRLARYTADNYLLAQLVALAVLLVAVTVLGAFAKRPVGRRVFGRTGRLVNFVPVFRTIYGSVKQMANSVSTRSSDFESAVYVEYERDGLYRLGLKTGESPGGVGDVAGEPAHNVFVPGSPNPTQGALLMVPESRVYDADLSVRAAIRILMTTGMADGSGNDAIELDDDELAAMGVAPADDDRDETADQP
ncbi:DUF502 domain-containing protein [Halobacterium sp. KA-6]|uniref:DUF502 domain-containing protein n=1 Tax=Halobacterium sp. KA-6 TaxID=2896368 RepID=UPI001E2D2248|nr:DUF502 domain-containing protein [Halobacterium sp. KA-6]MCD2201757.1 DUF502 domain-containing protein [Halobacterium sp. KA-6]